MSHHCHDEHTHSHGGHDHGEHDHSDDITPALQFSLYQHIDFDGVTALNDAEYGSAKAIVKKTWAERLSAEPELASDVDEQLLVNVPYVELLSFFFISFAVPFIYLSLSPFLYTEIKKIFLKKLLLFRNVITAEHQGHNRFTGQVKLHSILIRTSDSDSAPKTLKVIINRDDVDFGVAEETSGTQEFELSRTAEVQELPVVSILFSLNPIIIHPLLLPSWFLLGIVG